MKQSDIASKLGLNKTTVSKALRGSSDISEKTRASVLKAALELGYDKAKPIKVEQFERKKVAILCPEIVEYYYSKITTSLYEQLWEAGYDPSVYITGFSAERESTLLAQAVEFKAVGVVLLTEHADVTEAARKALGKEQIALVVIGLNYEAGVYDVISVDEKYGIEKAVSHLLALKRRHFAFIGDKYGEKRLLFLKNALQAAGFALSREFTSPNLRHEVCGYVGMAELLKSGERPDVIFAEYDAIAVGAFRAMCEADIRVPEDIALLGFDNVPYCEYLPVTLSSIDNHIEEMCNIALAILKKKIVDPDFKVVQTVAITPEYIIRESTSL